MSQVRSEKKSEGILFFSPWLCGMEKLGTRNTSEAPERHLQNFAEERQDPLSTRTNTTHDDLAGVIGFTATLRLAVWYGGQNLYVPAEPAEDMRITRLIGLPAAKRLAAQWGTETVAIPTMWAYEEDQRNRLVAQLLNGGTSPREIARVMGVSERRVQQIRRVLEDAGLVPMVLTGKSA